MYALPDFTSTTTVEILVGFALLALLYAVLLMRRKARFAQFETDEVIRIRDAAKNRQDWIAGIMKEYHAPVPTENVP